MNKLLSRLKDQLPDTAGAGSCNADSKVSILVKACEYIEKMQEKDNRYVWSMGYHLNAANVGFPIPVLLCALKKMRS